jgi:hypothetical protein
MEPEPLQPRELQDLARAIFKLTLKDYLKGCPQARAWLFDTQELDHPLSMSNVCRILGLDADAVRARLFN